MTRFKLKTITAALGIILLLPTLAQAAETKYQGNAAGWNRNKHYDDDNKLWACAASQDRKNSVSFGLIIARNYNLGFYLSNDTWKLGEDDKYDISISIDNNRRWNSIAHVYDPTGVIFNAPADRDFLMQLRDGQTIRFYTAQQVFTYSLQGSAISLQWITECISTANGRGKSRQGSSGNESRSRSSGQSRHSSNPFSSD
jgi:hypothetical protein